MSWRERLATLLAAQLKPSAATPVVANSTHQDVDLELVLDGRSIRAVSTAGSALPATIEKRTMRVTIAIIDVSGSMHPFLRRIDEIVCECNSKSSRANLPPNQFVVVCFSDIVNDIVDMSLPLEQGKIARMDGGTSYAVAFDAARKHIEQTRIEYPDAQFTIAFMTDGQDGNKGKTPAALQALHETMGPDDQMTAVFFTERVNDPVPCTLQNVSKPPVTKVPVLLLSATSNFDASYFSSWLASAVEKSATNLTLELPFGRLGSAEQGAVGSQRMMLNNNGETLSGACLGHWPPVLASAQETVVDAKIVAGTVSWPCKVRVKRATETIALTGQSLLQMLQSTLRECLQDTNTPAERDAALVQIRQIIQASEDPEVRKALTTAEIELLRRAAAGARAEETGDALTSQKTDQRRTYEQLLSSLALATQWSAGKARRAARDIDNLRARVTEGKESARQQIERLQDALIRLQEERLVDPASSSSSEKIDHLVTLGPIDATEVLVSLWTGPPTGEGAEWYTACVAANMGGVRGMPYQQAPYIGLGAWSQMCELNMTGNNAATIGIPVVPLANRTSAEDQVVALFAPLLCGLFATAQPILDAGHVAASQLLTTIGHVLQVTENKEEAHEFADVLVPYAWCLVQKLDPRNEQLKPRLIVNRNKDSCNFITSATAWLGYNYCVQRLNVRGGHYPGPDISFGDVYLFEAVRQACKQLHDTSRPENTEKLRAFCDAVAAEWTTMITLRSSYEGNMWQTLSDLVAVATSVSISDVDWDCSAIFKHVCNALDVTGTDLRPSHRLRSIMSSASWVRGWTNLPDSRCMSEWSSSPMVLDTVRGNTDTTSLAAADAGIGRSQLINKIQAMLIDAALKQPVSQIPVLRRWALMHERDVNLLVDEAGTVLKGVDFAPPGTSDVVLRVHLSVLAKRQYVREWFANQVRFLMSSESVVKTVKSMLGDSAGNIVLSDPRVQYLLCKEFQCSVSVFAAYMTPGEPLWHDHRRKIPSMNTLLSRPGQVVTDRGVHRVVDRVTLAADKRTVMEVVFLDGAVMRRTVDGGRCNSVTARVLGKPFEAQHEFVRFMVTVDDSHGPLPFVRGVVKTGEAEVHRPGDKLTALSSLAGYVCTWRDGKWTLESVYQWSPQRKAYVDVIHNFAYFEDSCMP